MTDDIIVTGMAWHTALGTTLAGVWQRLLAGETGIAPVPSPHALKNTLAAAIPDEPGGNVRDTLSRLTRAVVANALDHAELDASRAGQRTFLVVGTSFGARLDDAKAADEPLDQWILDIADELGVAHVALSTACSSGSDALVIGTMLIRSGIADRCICGGADILTESKRLAHSALGTMSSTTLRSFDHRHDGTILGEGIGFLVLERRGARPARRIATLRGTGSSNDAAGLTAPDENGNGIRLAVDRSLRAAGLHSADIGVVNAHGSGTLTNDRIESRAYAALFSTSRPIVFATKGAFGHTLGATGALEAIALVTSLNERVAPPIHGLESPLAGFDLPLPTRVPSPFDAKYGISVTIGFGGFNTSLVFERGDVR